MDVRVPIRFLDTEADGRYDLSGRAVATCPLCSTEITGQGYFSACANNVRKHYSLVHSVNTPVLP